MKRVLTDGGLRGDLGLTSVADLLQFLHASGKTGALGLSQGLGGKKARVYLDMGRVVHVVTGELTGIAALAEVLGWHSGEFNFASSLSSPRSTIDLPLPHALMEAARLRDEQRRDSGRETVSQVSGVDTSSTIESAPTSVVSTHNASPPTQADETHDSARNSGHTSSQSPRTTTTVEVTKHVELEYSREDERSKDMALSNRSSTEVLEDLLKVPGVDAVVVVGRDGFVIEMAGSSTRVTIDALGAALAHAINGIEEMGNELRIEAFSDLFIEYGRAVLMCRPVGDAVAVLVTPDASKLGIIRHKAKPFFEELKHLF